MGLIDHERLSRARTALERAGIDVLVCRLPENILLLSGYWPMNGFAALIFPVDGEPVLLAPQAEAALAEESWVKDVRLFAWGLVDSGDAFENLGTLLRQAAAERKRADRRIGYEGSFEFVAAPYGSAEPCVPAGPSLRMIRAAFGETIVDATDTIHAMRVHKTPGELDRLRIANTIAKLGLQAFAEHVVPGAREIDVAAAVESAVMTGGTGLHGVKVARAWASVMGGPRAAEAYKPHLLSTTRSLVEGDLALLELAVVADGWWSDLTRTRAAGRARVQDRERWDVVVNAQRAACAAVRPGIPAAEVDRAARTVIEQAGLGAHFNHHTGHGLGLRYHEPVPFLHPSVDDALEAGMVTSIEPGIYIAGWGGMRCEDDVVVTESGVEILSEFPRTLEG